MSFRGRLLVGLLSLFCFCLGITATVLISPNRSFTAALPHFRPHARYRVYKGDYYRGDYSFSSSSSMLNADKEMARTISGVNGTADQATLDKLQFQVSHLESSGRSYLGVYLCGTDYGGATIDYTQSMQPADTVLHSGDVITSIDGQPVTNNDSLRRALLAIAPGTQVTVTYNRYGRSEQVSLRTASMSVGNMPLSHRALGFAYASIGRKADALIQFESYRRESPYSGGDESVDNVINQLR